MVWGEQTSSISRESFTETLSERGKSYLQHLPQAQVRMIQGRNVLPVESTSELVRVVTDFWALFKNRPI